MNRPYFLYRQDGQTFARSRSAARLYSVAVAAIICSLLAGCGMTGGSSAGSSGSGSGGVSGASHSGRVFGGNQPVVGATIQLYAAGTSGYGTGATALVPTGSYYPGGAPGCVAGGPQTCTTLPQTDANGDFVITGDYACTAGQQVYIVATGGNTGAGGLNAQSAMMAVLGACPAGKTNFSSVFSYYWINEITTTAAVYALQQFMAPPASGNIGAPNIGAPSTTYSNNPNSASGVPAATYATAQTGLANAFRMALMLADITQGTTPNTNYAWVTPQSAKMISIANILASCVNSTGGTSGDGSACGTLFADATPSSAQSTHHVAAADTIQAAWYIAQNPSNNVSTLFGLGSAVAPFSGGLSAAPTDLTLAANLAPTIGGSTYAVNAPYSVAIDAFGNAWISNTASIMEIGADGSPITAPVTSITASTTGGTYSYFSTVPTSNTYAVATAKVVAIDLNQNAWVPLGAVAAGTPNASVLAEVVPATKSTLTAGAGASTPSTVTGFYTVYEPYSVVIDGKNNIYDATSASSSNGATTLMDERSVAVMGANGANFTDSLQNTAQGTAAGGVATGLSTSDESAAYVTPGSQTLLALDTSTNGPFLWGVSYNACKVVGDATGSTPWGATSLYFANSIAGTPPAGSDIASGFTNSAATGATSSNACGSGSIVIGQVTSGAYNSSGSYTTSDPAAGSSLLYATTAGTANPNGIAVDKNNGAWITDVVTSSLGFDGLTYLAAPSATGYVSTAYTWVDGGGGGTIATPKAGTTLAKAAAAVVDGNNNVWTIGQTSNGFVEAMLCTASTTPACATSQILPLTPGNGGAGGVGFKPTLPATTGSSNMLATPMGIAIDPSGNVWATNTATTTYLNQAGTAVPDSNAITVLVGAAAPVVTPLSVALANSKVGVTP